MKGISNGLLILTLCACSAPPAREIAEPQASVAGPTAAQSDARDQIHWIPVTEAGGRVVKIEARVCRPDSGAPATAVIINHGSPADRKDRPRVKVGSCTQEAAQWFLMRHYVVVFPLRRGYGESGGDWAESQQGCDNPNYLRSGLETARDIDAAVGFAVSLPFVRPDRVVVVGQSAGGWGTLAYASLNPAKVGAFIVMAGGRGGHHLLKPNSNCRPDLLIQGAARYGETARVPMLWIYTQNDTFFAPPIAEAMWREFSEAGGKGDFQLIGPYGNDGHQLFFGPRGSEIWGPLFDQYLARMGVTAQ